jgi:hypothetical protein
MHAKDDHIFNPRTIEGLQINSNILEIYYIHTQHTQTSLTYSVGLQYLKVPRINRLQIENIKKEKTPRIFQKSKP